MTEEVVIEYEQFILGIYLYHGPNFLHFDIRMILDDFCKTFHNVKVKQSAPIFLAHLFNYNGEVMSVRQIHLQNRDLNQFNEAVKIFEHEIVREYFINHYEHAKPKLLEYRKKVLRLP